MLDAHRQGDTKSIEVCNSYLKRIQPPVHKKVEGGRGMLFKVSKNKALEGLVGAVNANNRMCLGILVLGA